MIVVALINENNFLHFQNYEIKSNTIKRERKRLEFTDVDEKFKLCSYPIPYSRNNYDTFHRVLDSCWKNYLVDNKRLARCESSARTIHNPSPCFCNKDGAGESRPDDIPWTLLQKTIFYRIKLSTTDDVFLPPLSILLIFYINHHSWHRRFRDSSDSSIKN